MFFFCKRISADTELPKGANVLMLTHCLATGKLNMLLLMSKVMGKRYVDIVYCDSTVAVTQQIR